MSSINDLYTDSLCHAPFLVSLSPPFLRGFHLLHLMKRRFIMGRPDLTVRASGFKLAPASAATGRPGELKEQFQVGAGQVQPES
eukprot:3007135-Rhodomonas_salina.1